MVRPGRAAAAAPAVAGPTPARGRARRSGRPGRFLPAWHGLAPVRPGCGRDAVPWLGRAGAAGRGRRPAGRRADPGLGAGTRRAPGPDPGLPAAPARRAGRHGRGRLGRAGEPRSRRRADRALSAGPRGRATRGPSGRHDPSRPARCHDGSASICGSWGELLSRAGHARRSPARTACCSMRCGISCGPARSPTTRSRPPGAALEAAVGERLQRRPTTPSRPTDRTRAARGGRALVARPDRGGAPAPTERLHAQALAMLERHGVLTREAVASEGVEGGFSGVYPILRALEDAGRIRRGYFVDGLGAAQFALAGALDRLRAAREAAPSTMDRRRPPACRGRSGQPVRRGPALAAARRGRSPSAPTGRGCLRRPGRWRGRPLPGAGRLDAPDAARRRRPRHADRGGRWARAAGHERPGRASS